MNGWVTTEPTKLLLRPEPGVAIGRIMRSLLVTHTWRYHKRHQSLGHVWQGSVQEPAGPG